MSKTINQRLADLEARDRAQQTLIEALQHENADIKAAQRMLAAALGELTRDRREPSVVQILGTRQ